MIAAMTQAEAEVAPDPLRQCAPQLLVVPALVVAVRREVDGHHVGEGRPGLMRGQASPRDLILGLRRGIVHAAGRVDVGPPRLGGRSSRRCLSQFFYRSRHAHRGRQRTAQAEPQMQHAPLMTDPRQRLPPIALQAGRAIAGDPAQLAQDQTNPARRA
jgi:hypothetical protein